MHTQNKSKCNKDFKEKEDIETRGKKRVVEDGWKVAGLTANNQQRSHYIYDEEAQSFINVCVLGSLSPLIQLRVLCLENDASHTQLGLP